MKKDIQVESCRHWDKNPDGPRVLDIQTLQLNNTMIIVNYLITIFSFFFLSTLLLLLQFLQIAQKKICIIMYWSGEQTNTCTIFL